MYTYMHIYIDSFNLICIFFIVIISTIAAKKAAALAVVDDSAETTNSLEIIKPIDIKKMNGDALKEALKARGLGTQVTTIFVSKYDNEK